MSELERINALNLEPSLPKADDGSRSGFRNTQDRTKVKNEFEQFLSELKGKGSAGAARPKEGAATSSVPMMRPGPVFQVEELSSPAKTFQVILDEMCQQASKVSASQQKPDWPESRGQLKYSEVLGRATESPSLASLPRGPGGLADAGNRMNNMPQVGNGMPKQGNDQMQQQMRPMGPGMQGPQGMQPQGGFVMAGPGGQQGGQQQMMYMQGMPMQGQGMQGMMFGNQMGMVAMGGQNQQMPMAPMQMMAPQQGGPNPQGMQQFDGSQQQQQTMMFVPMPMQGQGNMGGNMMMQQQGGYMMQQPMYPNQANGG
jgi:hypothetical protein